MQNLELLLPVQVVDPSLKEEAAMEGSVTLIVNSSREVCAVHKAGGVGVLSGQMMSCSRLAFEKVDVILASLKSALELHGVNRVAARVKRHRQVQKVEEAEGRTTQPVSGVSAKVAAALSLAEKLGIDAMDFDKDEEEDMDFSDAVAARSLVNESEEILPNASVSTDDRKQAKPKLVALSPKAQLKGISSSTGEKKSVVPSSKKPGAPGVKRVREEVGLEDGLKAVAGRISGVGNDEKDVISLAEAIKKKPTSRK